MSDQLKTPWHLWVVGIIALLFNGMGGLDYYMTHSANEAYLGQFTPEQRIYFTSIPAWAVATWALSVWSAVLGSIMILLKKRWAVPLFIIAIIFYFVTSAYSHFLSTPTMLEVVGPFAAVFSLIILAITVFLYLYSKRMVAKGVLR